MRIWTSCAPISKFGDLGLQFWKLGTLMALPYKFMNLMWVCDPFLVSFKDLEMQFWKFIKT
jgi:hypothetical protein